MRFTTVGLTRTGIVVGAFIALEVLCRTGIIPRATMIPPTEMATAFVANPSQRAGEQGYRFTLINTVAAIALSVFLGFGSAPRCTRCRACAAYSNRCCRPITPYRCLFSTRC